MSPGPDRSGHDRMRCPSCGARNPETAGWCGQCYQDMRPPDRAEAGPAASAPQGHAETAPAAPRGPAAPKRVPGSDSDAAGGAATPRADADEPRAGRAFRRRGQQMEWRCARCDSWNPLEAPACTVCGEAFARSLQQETAPPPSRDVPEGTAVLASAVLPGLGHVLLGRTATGIARALLYGLWLVGGVALLRGALRSGQSALPAVALLGGAAAVWLASLYDALLAARGDSGELLGPRALLWLVVGVIGAVLLALVAATVQLPDRIGT